MYRCHQSFQLDHLSYVTMPRDCTLRLPGNCDVAQQPDKRDRGIIRTELENRRTVDYLTKSAIDRVINEVHWVYEVNCYLSFSAPVYTGARRVVTLTDVQSLHCSATPPTSPIQIAKTIPSSTAVNIVVARSTALHRSSTSRNA